MESEFAIHHDGRLALVCSADIPGRVCRLEYYREQKMVTIVFEESEIDPELGHYEMPEDVDDIIRKHGQVIIMVAPSDAHEAYGYDVPIVQIGV